MEGIQRLANMLEGQKDKYLKIIVQHLMLYKEMNSAFLNEEKNLKDMSIYIKDKAKKRASNGVAVIEDEVVFQWAKDYFSKSNKELGIKEYKIEKGKHGDVSKIEIEDEEDEFGPLFGETTEKVQEEKKEEIEQISLFGI